MLTGDHDFIRQWRKVCPQKVAISHPSCHNQRTYSTLDDRVETLGLALLRLGVGKGDRVAVLARSSVEQFEILFACLRLGAIFTPLNWRLSPSELADIADDCRPKLLVYDRYFESATTAITQRIPVICVQHTDGELPPHAGSYDFESLMGETDPPNAAELSALRAEHEDEAIGMILYTSGTTGKPKGVCLPHRQLFWNAINTVFACDLSPSDRVLAFLPMFHTGGLNCLALPTIYRGGEVIIMDAFEPRMALELMSSKGITGVVAVPAMYQMLLDHGLDDHDLSSLRTILCGGAPLPKDLLDAWVARGFAFRQGFGMTEIGPNCFSLPPSRIQDKPGSIGQVVLHAQAMVAGEHGEPLGVGEVGELCLRGPIMSSGYWQNDEATTQTFGDGWVRTGDLARYDEEGFFYIAGRRKEMFISGGENVFPAEVEAVIRQHEAVSDVCVVGVGDDKWGEVGLAVVVLAQHRQTNESELRAFCRDHLAGFKCPKHMVFASDLPRNASGKVLRHALLERYAP